MTETRTGFLHDNIWQFTGAIVGIIAILASAFVAYHVFFLQRESKAMQVVVLANTSLVEVEPSIAEVITVSYKGQPARNLSFVPVKLENSGTQPILVEDYEEPLTFVFEPGTRIVDAQLLEFSPPNIKIPLEVANNTATVSPTLFNPGDRAIFQFLVIDVPVNAGAIPFHLEGARIVGVKEVSLISALEERSIPPQAEISPFSFFLGLSLMSGVGFLMLGLARTVRIRIVLMTILAIATIVFSSLVFAFLLNLFSW